MSCFLTYLVVPGVNTLDFFSEKENNVVKISIFVDILLNVNIMISRHLYIFALLLLAFSILGACFENGILR
jgi:hypothetical protein